MTCRVCDDCGGDLRDSIVHFTEPWTFEEEMQRGLDACYEAKLALVVGKNNVNMTRFDLHFGLFDLKMISLWSFSSLVNMTRFDLHLVYLKTISLWILSFSSLFKWFWH